MIKRTINIYKLRWLLAFPVVIFAILSCDNTPTDQGPLWEKYWDVLYKDSVGLGQIFFVSNDEAWIIRYKQMLHYINGEFIPMELPPSQYAQNEVVLKRCHFSDPNHGWLVGGYEDYSAVIYQYLNGQWSELPPLDNLGYKDLEYNDVWALAPNDVWVSGGQRQTICPGFAWHFDGTSWTRFDCGSVIGYRMYFRSANEGYMCSGLDISAGGIRRWNGTYWGNNILYPGWSNRQALAIAFDANGKGFVITDQSSGYYGIFEIVGDYLQPIEFTEALHFNDIANNSLGDIWTLGVGFNCNFIAHWNGENWHYERTIDTIGLGPVFVKENGEVWSTFVCPDSIETSAVSCVAKLNLTNP